MDLKLKWIKRIRQVVCEYDRGIMALLILDFLDTGVEEYPCGCFYTGEAIDTYVTLLNEIKEEKAAAEKRRQRREEKAREKARQREAAGDRGSVSEQTLKKLSAAFYTALILSGRLEVSLGKDKRKVDVSRLGEEYSRAVRLLKKYCRHYQKNDGKIFKIPIDFASGFTDWLSGAGKVSKDR